MENLTLNELENINGGKGWGRVIEATAGIVLGANALAWGALAGTAGAAIGAAAVGAGALIDALN